MCIRDSCGLALAVVTRRPWLGHFPVGEGCHGRAVLILGEEDPGELQRRLHVQARAMELTREQRAAVVGILALPGASLDALALTQPEEHGTRAATPYAGALFEHLKRIADKTGKGWDVVILDPLSRFAGPDVEKDNSAATRLIQVLERRSAQLDPKEVREQARNQLREAKFEATYQDWAKELRLRAYIEMREPPLN